MKSNKQAVAEFRERLERAGYKRIELVAHPGDFAEIKAFALRLQKRRERNAKKIVLPEIKD